MCNEHDSEFNDNKESQDEDIDIAVDNMLTTHAKYG